MAHETGQSLCTGVIGCGLAATELHLPALQAVNGAEVVAVCDTDPDRAQAVAQRFGIPNHYSDPATMFAAHPVENVHLLTPPESHADLGTSALEAGAHVLIEKPFAYTVAEVDRVIAAAERTGKQFSVIHNELFNPAIDELRERIARGDIGELCWMQYVSARRDQSFVPETWYYETYGGRFGETLPHALCLLVEFLDGLTVESVGAHRLGHTRLPDGFQVDAGFDELRVQLASSQDNALADITYSFNANLPTRIVMAGTHGSLLVDPFGGSVDLTRDPSLKEQIRTTARRTLARLLPGRGQAAASNQAESSHTRQIRDWIESLRAGRSPAVTPAKARDVVRLWEEIVKSYSPAAAARPMDS